MESAETAWIAAVGADESIAFYNPALYLEEFPGERAGPSLFPGKTFG